MCQFSSCAPLFTAYDCLANISPPLYLSYWLTPTLREGIGWIFAGHSPWISTASWLQHVNNGGNIQDLGTNTEYMLDRWGILYYAVQYVRFWFWSKLIHKEYVFFVFCTVKGPFLNCLYISGWLLDRLTISPMCETQGIIWRKHWTYIVHFLSQINRTNCSHKFELQPGNSSSEYLNWGCTAHCMRHHFSNKQHYLHQTSVLGSVVCIEQLLTSEFKVLFTDE